MFLRAKLNFGSYPILIFSRLLDDRVVVDWVFFLFEHCVFRAHGVLVDVFVTAIRQVVLAVLTWQNSHVIGRVLLC